jgi:hypothetical protein
MQESGLGGAGVEYRWAVALRYKDHSARIDALPAAEVEALAVLPAQQERERLARIASELGPRPARRHSPARPRPCQ